MDQSKKCYLRQTSLKAKAKENVQSLAGTTFALTILLLFSSLITFEYSLEKVSTANQDDSDILSTYFGRMGHRSISIGIQLKKSETE